MNRHKVSHLKRPVSKRGIQGSAQQGSHLPIVFTRDKIAGILNERYTEADCSDLIWLRIAVDKIPTITHTTGGLREGSSYRRGEKQVERQTNALAEKKVLHLKSPLAHRSV